MEVRVRVPGALRELGGGRSVHEVELAQGATVADLLDAVAARWPALERRIRDERGGLRPHVNLFVGDQDVRALGGLATALAAGDEVSIVAAISGGAGKAPRG